MSARLSPELLSLLERTLNMIEKLEVAWHLTNERKPLSFDALCARIKLDRGVLEPIVDELAASKIIHRDTASNLVSLGARARRADFDALMQTYSDDPASVLSALTSIAVGRIRAMAAMAFSDAFVITRWRRRDEDE